MTDLANEEDALGDMHPAAPPAWGEPHHKTISWYDPDVAKAAKADMTGLAYIRAIAAGDVPPPPIAGVVGLVLRSVEEGEIRLASTPDASLLNTNGLVHGGVLCTLMDTAMGVAVQTTLPAGAVAVTIELKVSFLKPLPFDGREVSVLGRVLKPGRRVSFAEASAFSPDGDLIGHGSSSLATLGA